MRYRDPQARPPLVDGKVPVGVTGPVQVAAKDPPMRVLVIEDDPRIQSFVRAGLEEEGHAVVLASDLECARHESDDPGLDMIVLDLMLPDGDGEDLIRELRGRGLRTPILVLTAKDMVQQKVSVLDLGADDYLTKPFSFSELGARMRALRRRTIQRSSEALTIADLAIDPRRRTAQRGPLRLDLTAREFSLLLFLAENEGRVLTRRSLSEGVWDEQLEPYSNVIDVHINRLRKKVDRPFDRKLIHTIRGVGYVLRAEDPA